VEKWQRELKAADAKSRFTFAGMMFAVVGKRWGGAMKKLIDFNLLLIRVFSL